MLWRNTHRAGALVIFAFIVAHFGNHLVAALGPQAHQDYLSLVRLAYRHPIAEPALIVFLLAQASTGLWLAGDTFRRAERPTLLARLEIVAAILFAAFILIHLTSIWFSRAYLGMDTNFYWMASLMRASPAQGGIVAFHVLGVLAVSFHAGIGAYYFASAFGAQAFGRALRALIILFGGTVAVVAAAAYSGALFPIELE